MRDPDEDLVSRVGAGDSRAAAELVRRHLPRMVGLARRMLGDAAEAEDVAQEAFVEAFLCLHQLREPAAFVGWLRRIVLKRCDRATRRRAPHGLPDASAGSVDDAVLERRWLLRALAGLPDQHETGKAGEYWTLADTLDGFSLRASASSA